MHWLIGGGIALILLFVLLALFLTVFWIWMLVDAILSPNLNDTEKIVWALVIFFTHFIGALIYYFVGRRIRAY